MEPSAIAIQSIITELHGASRALERVAHALSRVGNAPTQYRSPARQQTPDERLSAKQLGAIRAAAKRGGLSAPRLAELVAEVSETATDIVDLGRREASALIDRLDEISGYRT